MTENSPAPGWYPSEGRLRWWDGRRWTEHTQPLPAAGPGVPDATPAATLPADTLWHAVGKPLTGIGAGRYRLTDRYLYFEKGTLRTSAEQVPIGNVTDVDLSQSMAQKARGVGTITVHYQTGSGVGSVELEDIPNFREGVHAINSAAQARREELQVRANTQTFHYQGGGLPPHAAPGYGGQPAPAAAPAAPAAPSSDEVLAQLEKLGKLRDAGIVTPAEFDAKKAELLARL